MLKYDKEINEILSILHSDWMDEDDKVEFNEELFKISGITREKLNDDIKKGVEKGHTVEEQMLILKDVFTPLRGKDGE